MSLPCLYRFIDFALSVVVVEETTAMVKQKNQQTSQGMCGLSKGRASPLPTRTYPLYLRKVFTS